MHELIRKKEDIEVWLQKYQIKNYTINSDLSVDVKGCVGLDRCGLKRIAVQFNVVTGSFICANNKLTSLYGAPRIVGKKFNCSHNRLTSLEYVPHSIGTKLSATHNQLQNLYFFPANALPEAQIFLNHNFGLGAAQELHNFSELIEIHQIQKEKLNLQQIHALSKNSLNRTTYKL